MRLKRVVLIGGSGFVGGWIANRLSERGMRVVIPSRHRDHTKKATMMPTVYVVEADVHDPKILADLMKGMDAVINLVGILHDGDSSQPYGKRFAEAHVELPKKIVAACKAAGVRRLVHMSALKASADASVVAVGDTSTIPGAVQKESLADSVPRRRGRRICSPPQSKATRACILQVCTVEKMRSGWRWQKGQVVIDENSLSE